VHISNVTCRPGLFNSTEQLYLVFFLGFFTLVLLVVHHCSLLPLIFIPHQFCPTLVPFAQQSTWSSSPSILTCLTGRAHCKIPLQPHLLFLPTPDSNSPSLWFAWQPASRIYGCGAAPGRQIGGAAGGFFTARTCCCSVSPATGCFVGAPCREGRSQPPPGGKKPAAEQFTGAATCVFNGLAAATSGGAPSRIPPIPSSNSTASCFVGAPCREGRSQDLLLPRAPIPPQGPAAAPCSNSTARTCCCPVPPATGCFVGTPYREGRSQPPPGGRNPRAVGGDREGGIREQWRRPDPEALLALQSTCSRSNS
jgi:hypothetical protein